MDLENWMSGLTAKGGREGWREEGRKATAGGQRHSALSEDLLLSYSRFSILACKGHIIHMAANVTATHRRRNKKYLCSGSHDDLPIFLRRQWL